MEKEESQTTEILPKNKNSEKIIRHLLPDRIFHWVMAVSILVLLFTGFLPIVGVNFSWVDPHWIAGIVLTRQDGSNWEIRVFQSAVTSASPVLYCFAPLSQISNSPAASDTYGLQTFKKCTIKIR